MGLPQKIRIREVGPREGVQTLSAIIPTEKKLALIDVLSRSGVCDIEMTAFVRADRVPQMADAEEICQKFKRYPNVRYTALYLNVKGFLRGEQVGKLDNEAWLYGAVSETFLKKNANSSVAESLAAIPEWLASFKACKKPLQGLMLSTAFGCNFEGEIPVGKVLDYLSRASGKIEAEGSSLKEVCLADTMGWATPEMLKRLVNAVREKFPKLSISLHLHDTRGSGMANVYAGLQEGIYCFDCSIGGLGGCPFAKGAAGNVCTEDVAFMCEEMGVRTGLNLDVYCEAAQLAESIVGFPLPGKLYKARIKTE